MEFVSLLMLGIGALLLVSVLATLISERIGAPLLLVFLLLGMLLGEDGPGGIVFNNVDAAFLVASLALAIILFDGGLRTPRASFRLGLQPAIVLATVGVVITAGITGAAAIALFDLPMPQGLLIGAIVGSTDAAAVFYLLHAHGLEGRELVVFRIVDEAPAVGVAVRDLPLPQETLLIAVVRGERPLATLGNETLAVDDHVYLLAHSDRIDELEALFGRAPLQGPRAEGFYGAFALRGDARVSEVTAIYGVDAGDVPPEQTLEEFLRTRFGHGVTVGDRIDVGNLAFIVRAVEGNRVTRVGLQLQPVADSREDAA